MGIVWGPRGPIGSLKIPLIFEWVIGNLRVPPQCHSRQKIGPSWGILIRLYFLGVGTAGIPLDFHDGFLKESEHITCRMSIYPATRNE